MIISLDCHPGCDIFAINALTASDSVIIPVEAHPLWLEGLDQVEKLIATVQRHLNENLKVEGRLEKYADILPSGKEIERLFLEFLKTYSSSVKRS